MGAQTTYILICEFFCLTRHLRCPEADGASARRSARGLVLFLCGDDVEEPTSSSCTSSSSSSSLKYLFLDVEERDEPPLEVRLKPSSPASPWLEDELRVDRFDILVFCLVGCQPQSCNSRRFLLLCFFPCLSSKKKMQAQSALSSSWAALEKHYHGIKEQHMRTMFERDPTRFQNFRCVFLPNRISVKM
jgi:hypothetical protein